MNLPVICVCLQKRYKKIFCLKVNKLTKKIVFFTKYNIKSNHSVYSLTIWFKILLRCTLVYNRFCKGYKI